PGITFGAGEGGNPVGDRPFLRGYDAGTDMFVDGVRDGGSQSREVFNVEQIDVVKGPSSAYGGRGGVGGSINIVTKSPKAENFVAGSLSLGTDATRRLTGDLNRSLTEDVAFRVNLMTHQADVAGRDAIELKRWGLAPSITFGMKSRTRVTLGYYHLQTDDIPDSGLPYALSASAATDPAVVGPVRNVDRGNFYGLLNRDFRKTRADLGTIRIDHDFGNGFQLRNTTRYGRTLNDYIWTNPDDSRRNLPLGFVNRSPKNRYTETVTAANLTDISGEFTAAGVKHRVAFGAEFSHEDTDVDGYTVTGATTYNAGAATPTPCPGVGAISGYNCADLFNPNPNDPWAGSFTRRNTPTNTRTRVQSVYAFDTIELTPAWQLNLGLRFDNYSTTSTTTATGTTPSVTLNNDSSFLNYQLGVVWKPVSNASVYVSYGTSSSPPGVANGEGTGDNANLTAAMQNLKPVRARNLEIGTKWDVLDRKLALTAAVFRSEISNARVDVGGGVLQNVGSKRVDGIEFGVAGAITRNWSVFGGYTHLDSELTDNGPVAANAANNGKKFPNTPSDSFSLWSTYQLFPGLTIGGGAFYMSKVFGNTANTRYVPSYWRFDAMAAYRINKNMDLRLNIFNLGDKLYYDRAYTTHYVSVAPGRSALLTLNLKY
ncbi:MAG: TonB-dependent receptor, partial [Burkholderiaceae bacterium]